jgi:hypothetical protein
MVLRPACESPHDHFSDPNRVVENVIGKETKHSEAAASEVVIAQGVVAACNTAIVRDAIDFDDKLCVETSEIDVVAA